MPITDIDQIPNGAFVNLNYRWRLFACEQANCPFGWQSFPSAGIDIASVVYTLRACIHKSAHDFITEMLRARACALHDAPAVIRIYDHARQTVRLAMNKPDTSIGFR
jgi:hypothetical protein